MVNQLPIEAGESISASDVPENMFEDFARSDLFYNFDWEIIPYDYDEVENDMAYFELIVEDKKVVGLNKDDYDDSWSLNEQNEQWLYQVIIGDEVHRQYRYKLSKILQDVMYQLEKYAEYNTVVDEYDEYDTWELMDVNETILDVKEELHCMGSHINDRYSIPDDGVQKLEEEIEEERMRLNKIESKLNELESVVDILQIMKEK